MEAIFRNLNLDERGLDVDGEKLTDLRFADDVALITSSVKDMETQLNNLNIESKKIGLKIHKGKTKYMTNFQSDEIITVENDTIEKVDSRVIHEKSNFKCLTSSSVILFIIVIKYIVQNFSNFEKSLEGATSISNFVHKVNRIF